MKRLSRLALVLAVLIAGALPAQAASVRPMELDALVDGAAIAFEGRVIGNRSEVDAQTGFIVTLTTFQVRDRLKGSVGATHTIKQLGGQVGNKVRRIDGIPAFAHGESYVVFLYGVSEAGFSSPVGLSQGSFAIRPGPQGLEVANGADFRYTLANVPAASVPDNALRRMQQAPGHIDGLDLADFKWIVRGRAGR